MWYLCCVPNLVQISVIVTEIDALILQTFMSPFDTSHMSSVTVIRIVFRSPGILIMIDGPEHDGNSRRRRPVESGIFSFILHASRGVPRADFILEHGSSLWPFSMTSLALRLACSRRPSLVRRLVS